MLEESKLPKSFWADAMATAAYVTARSPADGLKGGTPYEALFNRHVNPLSFEGLEVRPMPSYQRTSDRESSTLMLEKQS